MHNHHPEILKTWKVEFDPPLYFTTFIWKDIESMRRLVTGCEDCWGYTHVNPYRIKLKDNEAFISFPKKFADVHLVVNKFGSGTVSHEIQHVIMNYVYAISLDLIEDQEVICEMIGNSTTSFWNQFYENFERKTMSKYSHDLILRKMRDFYTLHQVPPTVRDVMEMCEVSSTSVVLYIMKNMIKEGSIKQARGRYIPRNTQVSFPE